MCVQRGSASGGLWSRRGSAARACAGGARGQAALLHWGVRLFSGTFFLKFSLIHSSVSAGVLLCCTLLVFRVSRFSAICPTASPASGQRSPSCCRTPTVGEGSSPGDWRPSVTPTQWVPSSSFSSLTCRRSPWVSYLIVPACKDTDEGSVPPAEQHARGCSLGQQQLLFLPADAAWRPGQTTLFTYDFPAAELWRKSRFVYNSFTFQKSEWMQESKTLTQKRVRGYIANSALITLAALPLVPF